MQEAALDPEKVPFLEELMQVRYELRLRGCAVHAVAWDQCSSWLEDARRSDAFVFGDRHFMADVLEELGLTGAVACSYPAALHGRLRRRHRFVDGTQWLHASDPWLAPQFVKPCRPSFRHGDKVLARILTATPASSEVYADLHGQPLFCSEVVEWMSEYRCYVLGSQVIGIHPYALRLPVGWSAEDLERELPAVRPTKEWVAAAVAALDRSGESLAGYCLDIGLIAFGEMALIERNDGFALTNYGLPREAYVDLHIARWQQVVRGRVPPR